MKIIYFNEEKYEIDEVVCNSVLFGATIAAAINGEGEILEIINIADISSIDE